MKKIACVLLLLFGLIFISSCNYDDSNDIDVITPTDSTASAAAHTNV